MHCGKYIFRKAIFTISDCNSSFMTCSTTCIYEMSYEDHFLSQEPGTMQYKELMFFTDAFPLQL